MFVCDKFIKKGWHQHIVLHSDEYSRTINSCIPPRINNMLVLQAFIWKERCLSRPHGLIDVFINTFALLKSAIQWRGILLQCILLRCILLCCKAHWNSHYKIKYINKWWIPHKFRSCGCFYKCGHKYLLLVTSVWHQQNSNGINTLLLDLSLNTVFFYYISGICIFNSLIYESQSRD